MRYMMGTVHAGAAYGFLIRAVACLVTDHPEPLMAIGFGVVGLALIAQGRWLMDDNPLSYVVQGGTPPPTWPGRVRAVDCGHRIGDEG